MKRQKRLSRVISMLLTLALVVGLLPTQALALGSYGEPPDQVAFLPGVVTDTIAG